jgi:hypothetical protein
MQKAKSMELDMDTWRRLYSYWQSKCVCGRPPSRSEIDPPIDIPSLAANLMIVDIEPEGYRFRLVGSGITSRLGFDITGSLLGTNGTDPAAVADFRSASDFVAAVQKPRLLVAQYSGRQLARNLVLILPLVRSSGETEKLFCGWFFDGEFEHGTRLQGLSIVEIAL